MFPGDDVIRGWIQDDIERSKERAKLKEEEDSAKLSKGEASNIWSEAETTVDTKVYPELGFATQDGPGPPALRAPASAQPSDPGAAAASKMFLGVAVAGFIMSDKRVKKYVEKKMRKK